MTMTMAMTLCDNDDNEITLIGCCRHPRTIKIMDSLLNDNMIIMIKSFILHKLCKLTMCMDSYLKQNNVCDF